MSNRLPNKDEFGQKQFASKDVGFLPGEGAPASSGENDPHRLAPGLAPVEERELKADGSPKDRTQVHGVKRAASAVK